jgi:hypothetical protein
MIFSENRFPLFRIMLSAKMKGETGCPDFAPVARWLFPGG